MSEPYGCAECGELKGHHGMRYTPNVGYHVWIRPTDQHILARMRHRRALRQRALVDSACRKAGQNQMSKVHEILSNPTLTARERAAVKEWAFPLHYRGGRY